MGKRFVKPWSPEELERLVSMHQSGARYKEIERALGRTAVQIKNALSRLRAKGHDLPSRDAGRPTTASCEGDWEASAKAASAQLRDAMLAYYARNVWSAAA